ncbi:MAG: hypothetical protein WBD20_25585 [Pirellulaceae bacterium]
MHHDYFGEIDFQDDCAELKPIAFGSREIEVEIDASDRMPESQELDALAAACKSHESYTTQILQNVTEEFDELLADALEVWTEDDRELLAQFNPDASTSADITAEQVIKRLCLSAIRLEVSDESEIAFDLHFALEEEMDYLVCGRFDCDGSLAEVSLES